MPCAAFVCSVAINFCTVAGRNAQSNTSSHSTATLAWKHNILRRVKKTEAPGRKKPERCTPHACPLHLSFADRTLLEHVRDVSGNFPHSVYFASRSRHVTSRHTRILSALCFCSAGERRNQCHSVTQVVLCNSPSEGNSN